jgi:hypothetical protein
METMIKREANSFIREDEVRAIQAKEWLTLKKADFLLNVSPLTLRRWTLAGKAKSKKMNEKGAKPRLLETTLSTMPFYCHFPSWQP